jgi:tRNA (guanine37-N1)-methyltransferase
MRIDIISCLPRIFEGPLDQSIVKRAIDKKLVELYIHDLRDYSENKHRSVDDYAFGGGAGMVLMIAPIANCIDKLIAERKYDAIIYMTPDGIRLEQKAVNTMSLWDNIIILCGHYKGVDERIREMYITHEISIGDYVLSGGEIAAAVLTDSLIRLIPGVLSDETSALTDSFQDDLLAPPVYTRPADYKGFQIPSILLSGHEKEIEKWRHEQAISRTIKRRPDLYKKYEGSE